MPVFEEDPDERTSTATYDVPDSPDADAEAVLAASRALLGVVAKSLAPVLEMLQLVDYRVLLLLSSRGRLDVGAIAELTGASPLAVDESARRLSALSRIELHGSVCTVTPRGRALVDEVTERRRDEIARILGGLDQPDRSAVVAGLRAFARATGEPPPERLMMLGI